MHSRLSEFLWLRSVAAALLPFDRMARATVRAREISVQSFAAPGEGARELRQSSSRLYEDQSGSLKDGDYCSQEAAEAALAFVLEGELDAARDLSRRRRLLLTHQDVTPERVFALLDDRGLGIVSKGTHCLKQKTIIQTHAERYMQRGIYREIMELTRYIAFISGVSGRVMQIFRQHHLPSSEAEVRILFQRYDRSNSDAPSVKGVSDALEK